MTPALKLLVNLNALYKPTLDREVAECIAMKGWPKFEMPTSGMRNGELFVMGGRRRAGKSLLVGVAKGRAQMVALFPEFDYAEIEQRATDFMLQHEEKARIGMVYPQ